MYRIIKLLCEYKIAIHTDEVSINSIFVALPGMSTHGNNFVQLAIDKGAKYALVDNLQNIPSEYHSYCLVHKDPINLLAQAASEKRKLIPWTVIGITGSIGKTSLKDILHNICSKYFKTTSAIKSYNNLLGMSLTILNAAKTTQLLILELGTNHPGEINALSKIAKPDIAFITNISYSHIGHFHNQNSIFIEKSDIYKNLAHDGLAIINKNDSFLKKYKDNNINIVSCGVNIDSVTYNIKLMEMNMVRIKIGTQSIDCQVDNILYFLPEKIAAIVSICVNLNIPIRDFIKYFSNIKMPAHRLNTNKAITTNNINCTLIDDCYNSNPVAKKTALDYLNKFSGRKIACIGGMGELGKFSTAMHKEIGDYINTLDIDIVLLLPCGQEIGLTAKNTIVCKSHKEMSNKLINLIKENDILLFKGSRSAKLEQVISNVFKTTI